MLILAVFLPIAAGLLLLGWRPRSRAVREGFVEGVTLVTSLIAVFNLTHAGDTQTAFQLVSGLPIAFKLDGVGSVFTTIIAFLWPLASLYAFEYMEHEGGENHFFALYTMTYGVTMGIATSANIITLYFFYEFLTLCTMPLVMHGTKREAVRAGHQYMMYSFFGAALAFVGVMLVLCYGGGGEFAMGGLFSEAFAAENPMAVRIAYLCMFLGFGVKAAIFPLHAWLPNAGVAPTPVTALLHAVAVVKSGVFAIIRMTYFCCGAQNLRGTAAQGVTIVLAAVTIVYGSSMAVKEHHLKRRLAYSTISNLSYIILASCFMTAEGLTAGLAHMLFHALIKITLFFVAGALIVKAERTQIEGVRGMGRLMPVCCAAFTVGALALTGTPLLPGFVSKWLIGSAAVESGTVFGYIGVAAILISAVLTAIYLLSLVVAMYWAPFAPDEHTSGEVSVDPTWKMKLPLCVLMAAIVLCGVFSSNIVTVLSGIASGVL